MAIIISMAHTPLNFWFACAGMTMPTRPSTPPTPQSSAFIALGSNLGDRSKNLSFGIGELAKLGIITPSPLTIESDDETGIGPPYLNTVVKLDAYVSDPRALLEECLRIEIARGRNRALPPNSPRTLDLDLISAEGWTGAWEWDTPSDLLALGNTLTLVLPHPRASVREFVMKPLEAIK